MLPLPRSALLVQLFSFTSSCSSAHQLAARTYARTSYRYRLGTASARTQDDEHVDDSHGYFQPSSRRHGGKDPHL